MPNTKRRHRWCLFVFGIFLAIRVGSLPVGRVPDPSLRSLAVSKTSQTPTDFLGATALCLANTVAVRRRSLERGAKDEEIGAEGEGDNLDVAPVGGMDREFNDSA